MGKKQPESVTDKQVKKGRKYLKRILIKDEDHFLFASFIVLLLAIIVVNTLYVMNRLPHFRLTTRIIETTPSKVLTSLQKGSTSSYDVTVSNVYETDRRDPAFTLASNETMLIFDINITNKTAQTQQFLPVNQLYVRSRDGYYATMHPSIYVTRPIPADTITPGKTISGQVSFNVPIHQAHPLLYVDLGWDNTVPIVFDVLR